MDHVTYLTVLREESEHFLEVLRGVAPDAPVPSCPQWSAADLAWHLAEVQHFWSQVARGADGDEVEPPPRPADDQLRDLAAHSGTELLAALGASTPDDGCWSWHEDGCTLGWVSRRQAHEALIHRVDAELAAGRPVRPPSVPLAVDGVDEVLSVMVDGVPPWGVFTPAGVTVRLECTNAPDSWTLTLGRFTGTSPTSGRTYDTDAASLHPADDAPATADLVIAGHAWDLDLWLWGRGDTHALQVTGPAELLERFRALVVESTQ